jgi:hypothetical protein
MAIKNIAKADALIRQLAEDLKIRTKGSAAGFVDTVREAKDAEGYPYIVLSDNGNEAAGQPVLFIRIKQIDAVSKDIFGNDLKAYAPHICELAYELDGSGQAYVRRLDLAKVMFELVKLGVKMSVKEIANGTAVTAANVDAASAALELDWLRWPTKGT